MIESSTATVCTTLRYSQPTMSARAKLSRRLIKQMSSDNRQSEVPHLKVNSKVKVWEDSGRQAQAHLLISGGVDLLAARGPRQLG